MYSAVLLLVLFAVCTHAFVPSVRRAAVPTSLSVARESVQSLTQAEMVDLVSGMTGSTKASTKATIDAFIECLKKSVFEEEKEYKVNKFGSFKPKFTKARTGRNPKTGEELQIAAGKTIAFSPAKAVKEKL